MLPVAAHLVVSFGWGGLLYWFAVAPWWPWDWRGRPKG